MRDREGEGVRHLGTKTEESLGYENLGKSCATKKGKRTAKHEKGERKKLNL